MYIQILFNENKLATEKIIEKTDIIRRDNHYYERKLIGYIRTTEINYIDLINLIENFESIMETNPIEIGNN